MGGGNESKVTGPVMPFYVRDFMLSTTGWTAEEVGHYIRLLAVQWEQGGLPADLASLKRVSPGLGKSWKKLEEKFPIFDEKTRRNPRLESHRKKALEFREKASKAGKKGNERRWNESGGDREPDREPDRNPTDLAIAPTSLPNPNPSPSPSLRSGEEKMQNTHTPHARGVDVPGQDGGGWALREWVAFVHVWNRTERAVPWTPLTPPNGWVDVAASPGWLDRARAALDHLPRCRWFGNPLAVTRFLSDGYVDRILAGEFDQPKPTQSRNGDTGKPLPDPTIPPF